MLSKNRVFKLWKKSHQNIITVSRNSLMDIFNILIDTEMKSYCWGLWSKIAFTSKNFALEFLEPSSSSTSSESNWNCFKSDASVWKTYYVIKCKANSPAAEIAGFMYTHLLHLWQWSTVSSGRYSSSYLSC